MNQTQISVKGQQVTVREFTVGNANVVLTGRMLRQAAIKDEEYVEGNPVPAPESFVAALKARGTGADVFTFAQRIPDLSPKFSYPLRWENAAAIRIKNYEDWWGGLSQETRRNVRLATKRGAEVKAVAFNDDFVRGIAGIYNETPFRQGKRFWHYGKDLETVRRENGTYAERSEFIGAFCGSELIGFIKMVYVDRLASIMQILSKAAHQDKRPTNALVAKAVELASAKGATHLLYCKYVYHFEDALTEFKRRNGFEKVLYPRYYVPLSLKGALAIKSGLHLGVRNVLPKKLMGMLLSLRSRYYERTLAVRERPVPASEAVKQVEVRNSAVETTQVR